MTFPIRKPVSPANVRLSEANVKPNVTPLPMIDSATFCDGKFCKLKDRVIPDHLQRYKIGNSTLCRLCLVALNGNERHTFDDNAMMLNGITL